jgi:Flp pilus assembly protein TadD
MTDLARADAAPTSPAPPNVPPNVTPQDLAANVTPSNVAPQEVTPQEVAPNVASPDVAPPHLASPNLIQNVPQDVTPGNVEPGDRVPEKVTSGSDNPTEGRSPTELGVARAAALFERIDPGKAAALLETVLAADPQSAEGWILMSRIRLVLDQAEHALDAAGKAIALVPEDPRPLAAASRALTLLGRHEEAVTLGYRAVIVDPKNPLWHDRVAWSLLAADRQIADAEQAARTAIGLDPNEAHYYFTHGMTLDSLGHADQARQALLISLRLEPENPVAQHRLAVLNGESPRTTATKRRGWRMFGRRATDGAGRVGRPEEYLT